MKRLCFFVILSLSVFEGLSQSDYYVSLKKYYDHLRKENKQDSALMIAREMNTWALDNKGDTSLQYAVSFRFLGNVFVSLQKTDSAIYYYNRSLNYLKRQNREINQDYASCLNNLGVLYFKIDDYKSSERFYKQALEIRKFIFGEQHYDYGSILNNLGSLYYKMGDYKSAVPYLKQALEINKNVLGEHNLDLVSDLNNLGALFLIIENYKSAEIYYKQVLKIRQKVLGEKNSDFAMSLNTLGNLYSEMGEFQSAKLYFKKELEILGNLYGDLHPKYAKSLNDIGNLYSDIGDYKSAEICYKQALQIRQKVLGEKNPHFATTLDNLGSLYSDIGDYKSAEIYYKQALEIRRIVLGDLHPDFAGSLNNLGLLYTEMGEYSLAESFYIHTLEIKKKAFGEQHTSYASSLNNFGIWLSNSGDYKSAEIYYKQALNIRKIILGEQHPDFAQSLYNLGILYTDIGDYKSAEIYYKQALDIRKNILGEQHPHFASSLNNLGNLYSDIGDYKSAEIYYKQVLEIRKNVLGEGHPDFAACLNNLGNLYADIANYKLAENYYKKAHEIKNKVLSDQHPDFASSMYNLGLLYEDMRDYKSAEIYYKQALEIRKNVLGEGHPLYFDTENSIAFLLLKTNREQESYNILSELFSKNVKQISDNFEWLSDNQKEYYWKKERNFYERLSTLAINAFQKVPETIGLNYNATLVAKGRLLEIKISSEKYYSEKYELNQFRQQLASRRRVIAKMESNGSLEKVKLEKLRREADSIDKEITLSWPEYSQQKKNLTITWEQVQQNLDSEEAAIEFVRFKNEDDSLFYYNALILKKGDRNPTLIKLCKEKDLSSINPSTGFGSYYKLVWQPLETTLNGIKTIYYSPDGELNNIPFHAIYNPKGKEGEEKAEYLMDRYTLHQLTSTRYLAMNLKQNEKKNINNDILLVGGVNYEYLPGIKTEEIKGKNDKTSSRSSQFGFERLEYLEGTKIEVEQIAKNVMTKNWQVTKLENNEATEDNIIKQENKEAKAILHIATHGFAFPEYNFRDSTISKNSLRYTYRYSNNPMVRSGLILAGGNWAWTGSDTLTKMGSLQNGILTALEVSQLNLKKTKLVVLSACETGLGKIEGSEGTFGLKRGFKLAGVEQLIVSLWSVPDEETMELMTFFYTYLSNTLNPVSSFEKAQKDMRNKYPNHPEKWAGFVLVR